MRLLLWRTDTDTIEPGQWLKGRIYEDMAALSPNGELLAYFARDERARRQKSGTNGWIAISRPPYLTALALWFPYGGIQNNNIAFSDFQAVLLNGVGIPVFGHEPQSYLIARGWQEQIDSIVRGSYQKPLTSGNLSLELRPDGWDWKPWLRDHCSGAEFELSVDQAEVDPAGRLVLIRAGKLFVATVGPGLVITETELADFNDMTFEPIAPPDWAKEWPTL